MKRTIALALAATAVFVALAGCQAKPLATKPQVMTEVAKKGQVVRTQELSGVLVPGKSLSIFAKLSGIARNVTVEVGDRVKAGQIGRAHV